MRTLARLFPSTMILVASFYIPVCSAAEEPSASVSFDRDILPIFQAKCRKCHGSDVQKGELNLQQPDQISKGGESGAIIVSGKSTESRLYEVLQHGEMPPAGETPLTAAEVETVRRWIDAGASFGASSQQARTLTQHDVIPILLLRCTACHGRQQQEGGLDLRTPESILKGGQSGPAIVPRKPDESLLIRRVSAGEMPPHQRLTEASVKPMEPDEIMTISRWIEQGATVAAVEPDLAGTADDPMVRPQDREFWSFQPPQRPAIPTVHPSITASPIDAFIAEKLVANNLSYAPAAEKITLIRRVTFDLTGLPPTPAEVREFLQDESPDAFERVVDRLLASPRYGERWGRHWLDVAGYAECEGRREQHLPRPFAWRYRDYVIRAFNADKPYDRFLQEQLAGDELADYQHAEVISQEIEDNLVATAFLRMSPDPTWANLTGYVPDRLEVTADAIDVLGSGVMGLTFKCARCHTHKFDPIPQRDYYRLAALLKGAYDEHDWLKPQLLSFGGAMSAGFGERFLPYVRSDERRRWEASEAAIQSQISELSALPKSDANDARIRELQAQRQPEPKVMALWDRGDPSPTYVYRRGNSATAGAFVQPGVPAVLMNVAESFEIVPPWNGATATGRRLALARWLTNPRHPLTARVFVNRVWQHHFGQGIVRSLGNFGKTGDPPSHPKLLDYLATEFIQRGWSLKALQRQILQSAAYRQGSQISEQVESIDPSNKWLSRMPLTRLDAEELRDSILFVAGELRDAGGGPSEPVQVRADGLVQAGHRRSIYVQQLRKHPVSLLESFDLPSMNPNCLLRSDSLVPTQALHLWNDATIRQLAARLAQRGWRVAPGAERPEREQQIEEIYWLVLSRPPTREEREMCCQTLHDLTSELRPASHSSDDTAQQALALVCHTLLNSADFLYID